MSTEADCVFLVLSVPSPDNSVDDDVWKRGTSVMISKQYISSRIVNVSAPDKADEVRPSPPPPSEPPLVLAPPSLIMTLLMKNKSKHPTNQLTASEIACLRHRKLHTPSDEWSNLMSQAATKRKLLQKQRQFLATAQLPPPVRPFPFNYDTPVCGDLVRDTSQSEKAQAKLLALKKSAHTLVKLCHTSEEHFLRQEESQRRRKQRLIEVRRQEKRIAQEQAQWYKAQLKQTHNRKRAARMQVAEVEKSVVLSSLHAKYNASLAAIGDAHTLATELNSSLQARAKRQLEVLAHNDGVEDQRFSSAVEDALEDVRRRTARERIARENMAKIHEIASRQRAHAEKVQRHKLERDERERQHRDAMARAVEARREHTTVSPTSVAPVQVHESMLHHSRLHAMTHTTSSSVTRNRIVRHNVHHAAAMDAWNEGRRKRHEVDQATHAKFMAAEAQTADARDRGAVAERQMVDDLDAKTTLQWLQDADRVYTQQTAARQRDLRYVMHRSARERQTLERATEAAFEATFSRSGFEGEAAPSPPSQPSTRVWNVNQDGQMEDVDEEAADGQAPRPSHHLKRTTKRVTPTSSSIVTTISSSSSRRGALTKDLSCVRSSSSSSSLSEPAIATQMNDAASSLDPSTLEGIEGPSTLTTSHDMTTTFTAASGDEPPTSPSVSTRMLVSSGVISSQQSSPPHDDATSVALQHLSGSPTRVVVVVPPTSSPPSSGVDKGTQVVHPADITVPERSLPPPALVCRTDKEAKWDAADVRLSITFDTAAPPPLRDDFCHTSNGHTSHLRRGSPSWHGDHEFHAAASSSDDDDNADDDTDLPCFDLNSSTYSSEGYAWDPHAPASPLQPPRHQSESAPTLTFPPAFHPTVRTLRRMSSLSNSSSSSSLSSSSSSTVFSATAARLPQSSSALQRDRQRLQDLLGSSSSSSSSSAYSTKEQHDKEQHDAMQYAVGRMRQSVHDLSNMSTSLKKTTRQLSVVINVNGTATTTLQTV
ncbi:hypothetical protein B5M09_001801 [Aphanomyces astaci]|uniref:Uncharacterized protein n=1 Tax=Aphanomyces astaci TaxID=112090 RepID=A0A425D6R9_APHAT|nr:hypothetical protein B5M09_001801 [Aphanomyces astaci]